MLSNYQLQCLVDLVEARARLLFPERFAVDTAAVVAEEQASVTPRPTTRAKTSVPGGPARAFLAPSDAGVFGAVAS